MADAHQRSRPEPPLLIRARMALPIVAAPIRDAGIVVRGRFIRALGEWKHLSRTHRGRHLDLGDSLVLPGLINAHCHLDYTHMAGLFAPPRQFTDWIKLITTTKQTWSDAEFKASWKAGAAMLLRTGTTTVADIEAVPTLLPAVWASTPLRVHSFLEMTGIRARRDPRAMLAETLDRIRQLPRGRCQAWLSPHAPYSTKPELMQRAARISQHRRRTMTTHVAESVSEYQMFKHRRGELFRWLERNERDMSDCARLSPVQQLEANNALGPHLLAIHVNYLGRGDVQRLADTGTHVVHCPNSHAYFQHRPFPFHSLHKAGINVCLGTDSLASTRTTRAKPLELSLFAEMREFARHHPRVPSTTLLRMATVNAAKALGVQGHLGELSPGSAADLIAIPFHAPPRQAARTATTFDGSVQASMIGGRWVVGP